MPDTTLIDATAGARLYYADSATTAFGARVVERTTLDGRPAVCLAATYFYPTSGGQPHDSGRIGPARVIDVQMRPTDEAVLHVLDRPLPADVTEFAAQIDWSRRFDHMQQHTGQHILSQAFVRLLEADTIGFHLGSESCTIDLDLAQLDAADAGRVEQLANAVVWENRPVAQQWIARSVVGDYPLRKLPDVAGDWLRIVTIADFDVNACGGTHVAATGAVGLIKITRVERIRQQVRVEFRCGARAVRDYGQQQAIVQQLASALTCAPADLAGNIDGLRSELKQTGKALKQAQQQLLSQAAERLLAAAEPVNGVALVATVLAGSEYDVGSARQLAQLLVRERPAVALLALATTPAHLIFARSAQVSGDMGRLLRQTLAELGGSGGGGPQFAQGGGLHADAATLARSVQAAADHLRANL